MRRADLIVFCRKLPHATEDIKWGNDLVFSIGGKMFAAFDNSGGPNFGFKCTPEEFARLTTNPGIIPAPYAARLHWVSVRTKDALPLTAAKALVLESYELVRARLPRKVQAAFGTHE